MCCKVCLLILDGFGLRNETEGNAVKNASTPNIDALVKKWGMTELNASGEAVGLPKGQMGNSEVGHLAIGSGRIIYQDLALISKEISDGSFYEKKVFDFLEKLKSEGGNLHLIGLLSKGGVHSHMEHLKALLLLSKKKYDPERVFVHAFTDGRDVKINSSLTDIPELSDFMKREEVGTLSSICGRYYAMDRDKRWERIEECYKMIVGKTEICRKSPIDVCKEFHEKGITDEFFKPVRFSKDGVVKEGDAVIFFNFRPDRGRELTRVLAEEDFKEFKRDFICNNMLTMTEYDSSFKNVKVIYKKEKVKNTLSETVSKNGLKQLKIAETEKYAHVTFFLNGGREEPFEGEDRILVPSPKVATYDLKPEMSAREITEKLVKAVHSEKYDAIIVNYANPDMVGHTGSYEAAVKAIEVVDECLGEVRAAAEESGVVLMLTADHGNSEEMIGEHLTTHTTNPVFFALCGKKTSLRKGGLSDISPTILELLGVEKPKEMTGESLIVK